MAIVTRPRGIMKELMRPPLVVYSKDKDDVFADRDHIWCSVLKKKEFDVSRRPPFKGRRIGWGHQNMLVFP